jgi:DNA repair photolyase
MQMKKRCGRIASYQDWIKPKIVGNALELLEKELPRLKKKIKRVFLCFATDPFMYQVEEVTVLTLEILKRLNQDSIKTVLITKGVYPAQITNTMQFNNENEYGITIVSLSEEFREQYEPHAAPIKERIEALRKLHNAGLKTWVSMEPYPTPNMIQQDIRDLLQEMGFVDKIIFGKWNYNRQTSAFIHSKQFYNSMAYEVVRFCRTHSIDVHIKEGTIRLDCLAHGQSSERDVLVDYA